MKTRPIVIISPKGRKNTGLATVVPLSTTPPSPPMPWHVLLSSESTKYQNGPHSDVWAKADCLATLRFERLDRVRFINRSTGKRTYKAFKVTPEDLEKIKSAVLAHLSF